MHQVHWAYKYTRIKGPEAQTGEHQQSLSFREDTHLWGSFSLVHILDPPFYTQS